MNKVIYSSVQKRWVIVALFGLIAVFGYYSWKQLAVEAYPDLADVTSQVVTQVPGLAAEEVEQQITIPIERALNGLPGMHVMRSKSTFGLSMITVVFRDGKSAAVFDKSQKPIQGSTIWRPLMLRIKHNLL